ncbi:hypothetical protein ANO11243_096500 [Dothideomycetidae sp. 11243]|nr:hypothetical protein ANO11243_096500 [fungal sp. No.11243]
MADVVSQKKYEKAKDRFKLQRAKNDEAMHKARSEFLEKEKGHWRNVAVAQEAEEWERKLKTEAMDLVAFLELEKKIDAEAASSRNSIAPAQSEARPEPLRATSIPPIRLPDEDEEVDTQMADDDDQNQSTRHLSASTAPDSREVTPDVPPSLAIMNYITPAKQTTRIRVDFGDSGDEEADSGEEDKENARPPPQQDVLKTPLTIDRAAALAAIEYRRGRARSFVNGQVTPKVLSLADKRDVSAPAAVTMSVGRKR